MIYDQIQGARQVYFVPIVNVEEFLASYSYYVSSRIPIYRYPQSTNTSDVQTIGVKATFVTSASMAESIVYTFAKEVLGNFRSFQIKHPTYGSVPKKQEKNCLKCNNNINVGFFNDGTGQKVTYRLSLHWAKIFKKGE